MSHSTVVSRESVRMLLPVAALNDSDILGCDAQNAFPLADNLEKHCLIAGDEFGHEKGKIFIVVRALHGLNSASAALRSFVAKKLDKMNFASSTADPAIESVGSECCECVSCCVDDILAVSTDLRLALEVLKGGTVKFENDEIETPEMCLGAKLQKKSINRVGCWAITGERCIQAAVNTVKASTAKSAEWSVTKGAQTPMDIAFVAEFWLTEFLLVL